VPSGYLSLAKGIFCDIVFFVKLITKKIMYIRRKKTPNSKRQSIQIVEGYRDEKGNVKQRIVRHLGVFVDEIEEAKLVLLAQDLILKIKAEWEA
jgi:hypothetical protein